MTVVAGITLVAGMPPVPFAATGTIRCTSGAGPVSVVVSGIGGNSGVLTPGGPGFFVSVAGPVNVPVYSVASPIACVAQPRSVVATMPRTAANLGLAKLSPNLNLAITPAPPQIDAPISFVAVPGAIISLGDGAGAYTFEVTQ